MVILIHRLSQVVFNVLDSFFGFGHTAEWTFPAILSNITTAGCKGWLVSEGSQCKPMRKLAHSTERSTKKTFSGNWAGHNMDVNGGYQAWRKRREVPWVFGIQKSNWIWRRFLQATGNVCLAELFTGGKWAHSRGVKRWRNVLLSLYSSSWYKVQGCLDISVTSLTLYGQYSGYGGYNLCLFKAAAGFYL